MSGSDRELLSVDLDVWHPDCWSTEVVEETGAGVFGHGSATADGRAVERCTIYGDSADHVADAVAVAKASDRLEDCQPIPSATPRGAQPAAAIGARTRDVRIEYEREDGIGPAFTARGFLLDGRSHMTEDGERWPFHVHTDRDRLEATLETIQREHEVDITLGSITTNDGRGALTMDERHAELAPRQRDAFALARKRGYYNWPRDVTAATLADELGVAEPTFLEYLRTAESTLLDPGR